jgi:hypothetical protein
MTYRDPLEEAERHFNSILDGWIKEDFYLFKKNKTLYKDLVERHQGYPQLVVDEWRKIERVSGYIRRSKIIRGLLSAVIAILTVFWLQRWNYFANLLDNTFVLVLVNVFVVFLLSFALSWISGDITFEFREINSFNAELRKKRDVYRAAYLHLLIVECDKSPKDKKSLKGLIDAYNLAKTEQELRLAEKNLFPF